MLGMHAGGVVIIFAKQSTYLLDDCNAMMVIDLSTFLLPHTAAPSVPLCMPACCRWQGYANVRALCLRAEARAGCVDAGGHHAGPGPRLEQVPACN